MRAENHVIPLAGMQSLSVEYRGNGTSFGYKICRKELPLLSRLARRNIPRGGACSPEETRVALKTPRRCFLSRMPLDSASVDSLDYCLSFHLPTCLCDQIESRVPSVRLRFRPVAVIVSVKRTVIACEDLRKKGHSGFGFRGMDFFQHPTSTGTVRSAAGWSRR